MEGQLLAELYQKLREVGSASPPIESSFEVKVNPLRVDHEPLVSTKSHSGFDEEGSPISIQKNDLYWSSLGSVKSVLDYIIDEGK